MGSSTVREAPHKGNITVPYIKTVRYYNFASCGQNANEEGPVLYWIPYLFPLLRNTGTMALRKYGNDVQRNP